MDANTYRVAKFSVPSFVTVHGPILEKTKENASKAKQTEGNGTSEAGPERRRVCLELCLAFSMYPRVLSCYFP